MEEDCREYRDTELLQNTILNKVGQVIESINKAKHVDQVICSLYTLASQLFPLNTSLITQCIDPKYQNEVIDCKLPSDEERNTLWQAFYNGSSFPTLSRVLLLDAASNWLACFPYSARKHVYDAFFTNGHISEVVQILVPFLQQNKVGSIDVDAVHSNTERLLILCLFENNGILQMAREFDNHMQSANSWILTHLSRLAQVVASIPDKSRLKAPASFSSHSFFRQIANQLLLGVENGTYLSDTEAGMSKVVLDGTLLFVGEIFSRICRRGSADVLVSEVVPRIRSHVQCLTSSNTDMPTADVIASDPHSQFWLKIMEMIKDPYAVEIMSEQLLRQLADENISDNEVYWILWILFHRIYESNSSLRSLFADKYLLWKVFPLSCLRWVLQFSVLECPPDGSHLKGNNLQNLIDAVQRLIAVWSDRKFVQSASVEQQAYITAAVGMLLEKTSKEELDGSKDVMNSILQGVSCRLESPDLLIHKMASCIALVFSKIIDPRNPLYLDDSCTSESIDWDFGLTTTRNGISTSVTADNGVHNTHLATTTVSEDGDYRAGDVVESELKGKRKKVLEFKLVDPDEIVDPATLNNDSGSDQYSDDDDDASYSSDASNDSSLQPYDLSDDDTDLKKQISQLVDVTRALRKTDDADLVERALDVAEKLVRASPDELRHVASDLARSLVQVRCSDIALEGEEDPTEEKRQRALVALLVTCPFESLDTLNRLLYSPNVDISQRIMILDVMTDAAQELANTRTLRVKQQKGLPISTISENQPWFLPGSLGPSGAGPWKEISTTGTSLNWSNSYEREIPSKSGQAKGGKTRRWSNRSTNTQEKQMEWSNNKFPVYAAAFMLPAMQGYDKKSHGVDLLDRDFLVLGKLVHMLGVCMRCAAMHPEASVLAPPLLDMLRSRELCRHKEAYVRRAVLYAVSCILVALHPSFVASSLAEGNIEISTGLEWIRTWALDIVESDTDRQCYEMSMVCLHLHAEMALQVSRALESTNCLGSHVLKPAENSSKLKIKIPFSITEL